MGNEFSSEVIQGNRSNTLQVSRGANGRRASSAKTRSDHHQISTEVSVYQLELTPVQIRLIKGLWAQARRKGPDEPGRSILQAVIIRAPEVIEIFHFSTEKLIPVDPIDLHFVPPNRGDSPNVDFGLHARRFTHILDSVVNTLHQPEEAGDMLVTLGRKHAQHRGSGFSPKLWDVFAECMIEKTMEWGSRAHRNRTTQEAWGKIIIYMIEQMRHGYNQEVRSRRRSMGVYDLHNSDHLAHLHNQALSENRHKIAPKTTNGRKKDGEKNATPHTPKSDEIFFDAKEFPAA